MNQEAKKGEKSMKRASVLILIFSVLSVFFFLLLIFLRIPFPLYPHISYQDAIDLLTPLVLIPVYWLMYKGITRGMETGAGEIAFAVLASLWVLGQGMHLAANSINNMIGSLARQEVLDITGSDIFRLTYFMDEHLSHYLWHLGVLGLAALLIYEAWRASSTENTDWRLVIPAGILYGFTYFCIFLEGQTLPLGLPFALVLTLVVLIAGRRKLAGQPILGFFFVSCLLASVLFLGWGAYWRGFPQILDVIKF
jgi:hypothetical protein